MRDKFCPNCKNRKPFEAFNKASARKDGHQVYCKNCKLLMQRSNPNRKTVVDKYQKANRELCNARSIISQSKKRSYYSAKTLEWAKANPERVRLNRKNNYERNRGKEIARVRRRQEVIRNADNLHPAYQAEIEGFYQFCRIFRGFEVDHIVPLNGKQVSGLHVPQNLQILPMAENRRKRNYFEVNIQ